MLSETQQEPHIVLRAPLLARPWAFARSWFDASVSRTILAIVDQAIVSGARFFTTALIGRMCGPLELGNYALAFTLFSLTACAQEALVSVPFAIYGHRLSGEQRRRFAGSSLAHYGLLSNLCAALVFTTAVVLFFAGGHARLVPVVAILSITLPLACLVEFARRFLIAELELPAALVVDATMMAFQVAGLTLLALNGWLSAATAYACVAVAAAITGIAWLTLSRSRFHVVRARIVNDALHNWRLSRWLLAGQVIFLARGAAALWLLAAFLSPAASGTYTACETIVLMANPLLLAFNNILTPQTARAFHRGGTVEVRRLVFRWTLLLVAATGLLSVAFLIGAEPLLVILFGARYAGHRLVVGLMALAITAEGLGIAAGNGLWAMERPRLNFVAVLLGSFTAIGLTASLITWWGLAAPAIGSVVGRVVTSSFMLMSFCHVSKVEPRTEVVA
jgi:O-antigen/teichoic acid export membrane protein